MGGEFTWPERETIDIESMARDGFTRIDDIHNDFINKSGQASMDGLNHEEANEDLDEANLENFLRESTKKVFEGSSINHL